jgi:hypothetical protein
MVFQKIAVRNHVVDETGKREVVSDIYNELENAGKFPVRTVRKSSRDARIL